MQINHYFTSTQHFKFDKLHKYNHTSATSTTKAFALTCHIHNVPAAKEKQILQTFTRLFVTSNLKIATQMNNFICFCQLDHPPTFKSL